MQFERIYVEIGNVCNLSCSFCAGTSRPKKQMTEDEFRHIAHQLKGYTNHLYFHVMGEPLLHPLLEQFLRISKENGFSVCITTNGTLLPKSEEVLLNNADCIHKIAVSLHAQEGNDRQDDGYIQNAIEFARKAANKDIFVVLRLWNQDSAEGIGRNTQNGHIERMLQKAFPTPWTPRPKGFRLDRYIFLEYDGVFTWPTESKAQSCSEGFCHGLLDQLAVLADGTVVPCCLDANGEIPLGNLFECSLQELLEQPRVTGMRDGLRRGELVEALCQKCTFSRRFSIK